MEYNTSRSKMLMPEYGRNVQKMVEYLLTIEDPKVRLRNAEAIIELMTTLAPHLKTIEDYKHKLWDHLYQMTDFRLNVDSPYPPPTREEILKKPEPLPYPDENTRNKHFGRNFNALLERALAEPDPERKQGFTQALGYYMKLAYTNWHKEPVHDDMIKNELAELSNGQLVYETGGYRVQVESNRFKPNRNNNNNNNNNRNYKGNQGGGNRNYGSGSGGGGNNYNKNRNKYKNKNK
ncbi:MAG TPA: DUF4290 domain-containing protein [Flavipsychrobacter sp.]|nr:DUF4290 domain-containing protein [Flavipsychrobacter sp.]